MEMGLIEAGESFKELAGEEKTQVRMQALLAQMYDQSTDAINGFEKNQDSYIRRSQEMKATMQELSVTIGKAILPIMDSLVKKITPVIKSVSRWIENNPKLAKTIFIVTGAVSGLLAVAGILGIVLGAISVPVLIVIGVTGALIATFLTLKKNFDDAKKYIPKIWNYIADKVGKVIDSI